MITFSPTEHWIYQHWTAGRMTVQKSAPLLKGSLLKGSSLWKGSAFRPWELELLNMAILDLTNESSWNTHSIQLVFALLLRLGGKYYHCNEYEEGIVQLYGPPGRVLISCAGSSDVRRQRRLSFEERVSCLTIWQWASVWHNYVNNNKSKGALTDVCVVSCGCSLTFRWKAELKLIGWKRNKTIFPS